MTLTHFDSNGRAAQVSVIHKTATLRRAVAYGEIRAGRAVIRALVKNKLSKGDALAAAKLSGIMAAKRAADLIPLCHPISLDWADIRFRVAGESIQVTATAEAEAKTGVEMEALTAVCAACLTLYDMCKSMNKAMMIGPIYLLEKSGGRSGLYRRSIRGR